MTDRQRVALFILILGVLAFLGWLFAPFVVEHILKPLSVALWLFLRIFVLSIHQGIYWGFLILVALFWLARRLMLRGSEPGTLAVGAPNDAVLNIEKWFNSVTLATHYPDMREKLKHELVQMLVALFSSRQQEMSYSEVHEMLRQRQVPLPDPVYEFLFVPPAKKTHLPVLQKLHLLLERPRKWWRRRSGREAFEFHQSVEIVLDFMETILENSHDLDLSNPSNH